MIQRKTGLQAILALSLLIAPAAWAQDNNPGNGLGDDSNADVQGYIDTMTEAKGIIIRVPVNAQGEEHSATAELRVHTGDRSTLAGTDISTAWEGAVDHSGVRQLNQGDLDEDSNTCGWYRWRYGVWVQPYYYVTYRPVYYHYGYTWYFYRPVHYTWWVGGYRYYYYRTWYWYY